MKWYDVLSWWAYLVGALGLAGAIALAAVAIFGAPALAAVLGERIAKLIGEFINTTIGLVLTVAAVVCFATYLATAHLAKSECRAEVAQMQQAAAAAAVERDAKVAADIAAKYEPEIAALKRREAELNERVKRYEQAPTPANAAPGCKLGGRAMRLRSQPKTAPAKRGR